MSELGLTREQIHERILLVAVGVLLAVSAAMPWAREGREEYSGWGLVAHMGSSPDEEEPTFAATSPYLAFGLILVLVVLLGPILLPPAEIGGWVGQVLGWIAAITGLVLVALAIGVGRDDAVDLGGGLLTSAFFAMILGILYFRTAQNPWPTEDPRPTLGRRR
ncbi:hypothetical protein OG394_10045 [Kribbella sp. NBC_01245]|uniref:hypothetical protein n=1 Tax=Kribbella sp. NBC_01245 TaxID=2903578 RepID=UPI002E2E746F|nr:hypothetical protein [Kribbella sp. NBC_01245]